MPRIPHEGLVPRGDRLLIQAFPKFAKRLENNVDGLDKADKELLVKLLPGAIERSMIDAAPTNDLHESVEAAILQIVTVVKQTSFGSRNASAVEPVCQYGHSNSPIDPEETAGGVSEPELPKGSDTSQAQVSNTLPISDLEAVPGNGGESDSKQAGPRNPRVSTNSRLNGKAAVRRARRAAGESANDRG